MKRSLHDRQGNGSGSGSHRRLKCRSDSYADRRRLHDVSVADPSGSRPLRAMVSRRSAGLVRMVSNGR